MKEPRQASKCGPLPGPLTVQVRLYLPVALLLHPSIFAASFASEASGVDHSAQTLAVSAMKSVRLMSWDRTASG